MLQIVYCSGKKPLAESFLYQSILGDWRVSIDEVTRSIIGFDKDVTGPLKTVGVIPDIVRVFSSAFDQRVYEAICSIPLGETRTYGDIMCQMGMRGGAQAIGQALARNPVALFVPCHRVVGASGIGGYRWGVDLKQEILTKENTPGENIFW